MQRGFRAGRRRIPRWAVASATALVLIVVGLGIGYRLSIRQAIRNEVHYLLEMAQLSRELSHRLRVEIDRIGSGADREGPTDAIFELLRSCPLDGGRNEEVGAWRSAPRSTGRVDAARHWAGVAAEELLIRAAVYAIAARRIAAGEWNGVQVTQGEVDAHLREAGRPRSVGPDTGGATRP